MICESAPKLSILKVMSETSNDKKTPLIKTAVCAKLGFALRLENVNDLKLVSLLTLDSLLISA